MNNAELYQKSNFVSMRDVPKFLEDYASRFRWKKNYNRILDIGCGDGSVTNILQKHIPTTDFKLVGCDISKNMVDFANDHISNEQTSFKVLNIEGDLPKAMRESFDYIFSFYAINWVRNQEKAFGNIYNLLDKEGGCFLIFVVNVAFFEVYRALAKNEKWSEFLKDAEKYISPYHDSKAPENEVRNFAKAAGFVDIETELKEFSFKFESLTPLKNLVGAINPFNIPEDKYDDYIEDYFEILKDLEVVNKENDGTATLKYNIIIFSARKTSK